MHRLDPFRRVGVALDFAAQAGDVIVHGASRRVCRVAPDHVQKPLARDRFTGGLGHESEHGKFLRGEMEWLSAARGGLLHQVNPRVVEHQ